MLELYGTFGPSCNTEDTLYQMFLAGMTGMRLNTNHASLSESTQLLESYHQAAIRAGKKDEKIIVDLQGASLRIGIPSIDYLNENTEVALSDLSLPKPVLKAVETDDLLVIGDGERTLRILSDNTAYVLHGGPLSKHKNIKIEGKDIPLPSLSSNDYALLESLSNTRVTGVMVPFVKDGTVLKEIHSLCPNTELFAKIENKEGMEHLEEIIPCCDCVVIARGDLGNAIPLWELPSAQKRITQACLDYNHPFMVVTQMLTSMINNPTPTRAEVSDIFNAAADGATHLMLTNETAVGNYPIEAMRYLSKTSTAALEYLGHVE